VRGEVLERLLPKLAIGEVAEIEGRYLRVPAACARTGSTSAHRTS
jgi:hypothetical protein